MRNRKSFQVSPMIPGDAIVTNAVFVSGDKLVVEARSSRLNQLYLCSSDGKVIGQVGENGDFLDSLKDASEICITRTKAYTSGTVLLGQLRTGGTAGRLNWVKNRFAAGSCGRPVNSKGFSVWNVDNVHEYQYPLIIFRNATEIWRSSSGHFMSSYGINELYAYGLSDESKDFRQTFKRILLANHATDTVPYADIVKMFEKKS